LSTQEIAVVRKLDDVSNAEMAGRRSLARIVAGTVIASALATWAYASILAVHVTAVPFSVVSLLWLVAQGTLAAFVAAGIIGYACSLLHRRFALLWGLIALGPIVAWRGWLAAIPSRYSLAVAIDLYEGVILVLFVIALVKIADRRRERSDGKPVRLSP